MFALEMSLCVGHLGMLMQRKSLKLVITLWTWSQEPYVSTKAFMYNHKLAKTPISIEILLQASPKQHRIPEILMVHFSSNVTGQ